MKKRSKVAILAKKNRMTWSFWAGIIILAFLAVSYFISINVDSGQNYKIYSTLLGEIIFYNPFVLSLYIILAIVLIANSFRKIKR